MRAIPSHTSVAFFFFIPFAQTQNAQHAHTLSFLHLIIKPSSLRHPPVIQILFQPRNLLQALGVLDQLLHPLLLFLRQLDAVGFVGRAGGAVGEGGGGGDVEGAGFNAHDLDVHGEI